MIAKPLSFIAAAVAAIISTAVAAHADTSAIRTQIIAHAKTLATSPYQEPERHPAVSAISYIDYLGIRVRPGNQIWAGRDLGFEIHPMPLGSRFDTPIRIYRAKDGVFSPVQVPAGYYQHNLPERKIPPKANLGISGFRVTAPLNNPEMMDEVIVFQGASYFRALSTGQKYGLSARGLSIDAGQPRSEEFPRFTSFWIEEPDSPDRLVFHVLLDSPSVTGAYTFTVRPGSPTTVNVLSALFPRRELTTAGIAPLSSMYYYASGDGFHHKTDYRPQVHDSDGLLIRNSNGEQIWRPLRNTQALRASSFGSYAPAGFGLMQRQRDFTLYADLEANYHERPSAWIEPTNDWGPGSVELFEIPTESEVHDNIVAQWRPERPLQPRKRYDFNYRLSWPNDVKSDALAATVNWSRSGTPDQPDINQAVQRFVIDYKLNETVSDAPTAIVNATDGTVSSVAVQPNPMTDGLRVSFLFEPGQAKMVELRCELGGINGKDSEVWLYQWTRTDKNPS